MQNNLQELTEIGYPSRSPIIAENQQKIKIKENKYLRRTLQ
jgi:hypothetical protein